MNNKTAKKLIAASLAAVCTLSLAACGGAPDSDYVGGMQAPDGWFGNSYTPPSELLNYNYEGITENGFSSAATQPDSFFSLDRNTASYTLMRRQISGDSLPSSDSVRIEEYINYFDYDYVRPEGNAALAVSSKLFDCPWNAETKLMTVGIAADEPKFDDRRQNIVLLIDTSGSMYGNDRLGLVQQAFTILVENLDENDTVSIVTYAGDSRVALNGTTGDKKTEIINVLQDLRASGSTYGQAGLEQAYKLAQDHATEDSNNRVIIATDGDFNVGASHKTDIKELISRKRESGIYLSVLGVGMHNTNDTTMKTLAENGNGNYAYLDSVLEAQKVLAKELGGTLNVVAKDARINVKFDDNAVQEYRLIGYESKSLSQEEYDDATQDTGEIGSGHNVTAVYEVKLDREAVGNVATVEVKYKDPATDKMTAISHTVSVADHTAEPDEDGVFIGCVAEFGLILRKSEYKADANIENVISRLSSLDCTNETTGDPFKCEFKNIATKTVSLLKTPKYR